MRSFVKFVSPFFFLLTCTFGAGETLLSVAAGETFVSVGATETPKVLWVPVRGTIELGVSPYLLRAIHYADQNHFSALILDIDTFGGRIDAAVEIRDALLDAKTPTITWVHKRAISAGALISLATRKIFFSPGSTMGAATPIQGGLEGAKPVEDKFVSYFRAEMGATAEKNGFNRKIAESMVKAEADIPGLVKKDEVLTLTDQTALQNKISSGTLDSQNQVLQNLHLENAQVEVFAINWAERLVRFLTDPTVSGLLMTLGILGLIIEFQKPGVGLPGAVGVIAFVLFFFGKFLVHLAGWEEVILLVFGLALLFVEIFLLPGKLLPGILGISFCILALLFSGISSKTPFDLSFPEIRSHLNGVALAVTAAAFAMGFIYWWLSKNPTRSPLVLAETQASDYRAITDWKFLIGSSGKTLTDLRPIGKALIDGKTLEVVSKGEFISSHTEIIVEEVQGSRVIVKPEKPRA